ncbi:transposable element Tcb2 transposase [Trichonephila clavipes]|nr:transposable element Tcb2 transposase [Trichonephila clavipes]
MMDNCVQMWTRNYGALGQTARVCFGVGQMCPDVDKELWRLGPDGSGERAEENDKRVRERERTEGGRDGKERGDGKRVGERERGMPALNGKKGLSPEIGVKKTMNAGGIEIWNRFLETGSAGGRLGQGRRWATTPNEDPYLVLTALRHRNMNATLLQQHLRSATGTTVSTQTVRNRLHGVGLYARRPMCGSKNNPASVHESVSFGGGGVLVYGCISIEGRTYLYIIREGPHTARRYRDGILRPIVVPYAAAIGDDFILMDDNCRPHCANLVEDFLFEEGII